MTDKQADRRAIQLLRKVDRLRAELRAAERELGPAVVAYGRRRGYMLGYREYHMRSDLAREEEQAA